MNKLIFKPVIFFINIIVLFTSCEKTKDNPDQVNDSSKQSIVDVLNGNSGFDTIFNISKNLQGIGTAIGEIGVLDFTVESNSNLNYVFFTTLQSQQSNLYSYSRKSYNINSKSNVQLPTGADKSNKAGAYSFFRPYSNFFNYCEVTSNTTAGNTVFSAIFSGDVSATIPKTNTVLGEPDMGFLFPMLNSQRFPGNPNYDQRQGFFTQGVLVQNNSYSLKLCNPKFVSIQYSKNPAVPKIVANLLDISVINKGLTQTKFEDISYSFDLRSDSIFAYHLKDSIINGFTTQYLIKITQLAVSSGLSNSTNIKKIRHYSSDGKIIGMFFQDLNTKKCWTFSFDYSSHTFTKGIQNADLEFSVEGSDIDIDEYGNVFYSGIAGNGSILNGVIIYKKDISGKSSLVGNDNFLKFGEIIQLKYFFGKVYLAVSGRITNTYFKQLTFLKQQ